MSKTDKRQKGKTVDPEIARRETEAEVSSSMSIGVMADLSSQLKRLRRSKGMTLDELSKKSDVSRAMISKIERGESSPSAVLLGKLAEGLQVGISTLVGGEPAAKAQLYRPHEQPVFRDPKSGLERRSLSPVFPTQGGVDVVMNVLAPQGTSGMFPAHNRGVTEILVLLRGKLKVTLNGDVYVMEPGDSLFFHANVEHCFDNISEVVAEFIITIDGTANRAL